MDPKAEAALKDCSEQIKKDLDPSYSFLHSLYVKDGITHEDMEKIMAAGPSRESQVSKLLTTLPRRGPNAFSIFRNLLRQNHYWLADALDSALKIKMKEATVEDIHKKLVNLVNNQLVPLVYPDKFNFVNSKDHVNQTILKLADLLKFLENKTYKALQMRKTGTICIESLITEKLKEDRSVDVLSTEIIELKKRAKQDEKLREENKALKSVIESQRKKMRESQKVIKESKREYSHLKKEKDKVTKKVEELNREIQRMKKEIESTKSMCEITPLF